MSDDATSMISNALRTLQAGQDELRDLMERSLVAIREDIGVNMGRVDTVQDSSNNTRE